MGESLVAITYGDALYEAARELGREEEILEEVTCLAELMEQNEELREFLGSPAVQAEDKKQFAEAVLRGRVSDEMVNFIFVLIDKERTWHLGRIARHYCKVYDRERGVAAGKIYSAVPLSGEQVEASAEAMSRLLRKSVTLENKVDPQLIGGVKIQVDGRQLDRSLKGELSLLLTTLKL